jgi:hypothetical protein
MLLAFSARAAEPQWIWYPEGNAAADAPAETIHFRRTFQLPPDVTVRTATLAMTVDDRFTAFVNGKRIGRSGQWEQAQRYDVAPHLRPGDNTLAVAATNDAGAAGFIGRLVIELEGRPSITLVTNNSWRASRKAPDGWTEPAFNDERWSSAKVVGELGDAPWGMITRMHDTDTHFPQFIVPGHERDMRALRDLFLLHYSNSGPLATLWDEWISMSTLWPAVGEGTQLHRMRGRWRKSLLSRPIDEQGYVSTIQHDGTAHSWGWPFPLWNQGRGMGWHFVGTGIAGYDAPIVTPEGWQVTGGRGGEVIKTGWSMELTEPRATLQSPPFKVEVLHAPFIRINWRATGLDQANPYMEWTTSEQPDFSPERRVYFSPASGGEPQSEMPMGGGPIDTSIAEARTMITTYIHPQWQGTITGLRFGFDNPGPAQLIIKSVHTAYDTRHNINNSNYVRGCITYFNYTRDLQFLRQNLLRMRQAMHYAIDEFQTREKKTVYTTWVGHEGTSGIEWVNGQKRLHPGRGIGNNYWDLLPFGGEDCLASIYFYDTLLDLASLEEQIAAHPQWTLPTLMAFDPADLRNHAQEIKDYGTKRFWNESTGRFVAAVDLEGNAHDWGLTFLNTEAIYFDFATPEQAKAIIAWLDGSRIVDGDTSTGQDIYHWRFGPRSTTKRNIEYYFWGWSAPESIPFGHQVQDGGAVLGFSYNDLMARLKTRGPDDAWSRLREIARWFEEVQAEGGYRKYYAPENNRGNLQGGNIPGGLGMDREFFESILVPQVMLYGFMGFSPRPDGLVINPQLPSDWPSLRITRIHLHDHVLDIEATPNEIRITPAAPSTVALRLYRSPTDRNPQPLLFEDTTTLRLPIGPPSP